MHFLLVLLTFGASSVAGDDSNTPCAHTSIGCSEGVMRFGQQFFTNDPRCRQPNGRGIKGTGPRAQDIYLYKIPGVAKKLGYVSLTKTGSNNMREVLGALGPRVSHHNYIRMDSVAELPADVVYFTFVRNPWARTHSTYNMLRDFKLLDATTSFETFASNPDAFAKPLQGKISPVHWTPLYDQLLTEDGFFVPHYIGRLEHLAEDLAAIFEGAGATPAALEALRVQLEKQSPKHHREAVLTNLTAYYRDNYNDATRASVARYARVDIDVFCYEF